MSDALDDDDDFDDWEIDEPESRLLSALNNLGLKADDYDKLADAVHDLYHQKGGITAIYYYPLKGISVHNLASVSLTLLDRIYEAFKTGDEASSIDLIRVIISELDKLPPR